MSLAIELAESGWLPDALTRLGIRKRIRQQLADAVAGDDDANRAALHAAAERLAAGPLAVHQDKANEQHYEVPPGFFELVLGDHLKYSACWFEHGDETLSQAEAAMLALSSERAGLADGQAVLELGCGWGSWSLWMAARYPSSRITAVSNSAPQRRYILDKARQRGLTNLVVLTEDLADFDIDGRFDRIVSIECFEHLRNYRELLHRLRRWLRDDGRVFVHVFCHRAATYLFEVSGDDDWMSRHFFTGGLMPARDLFAQYRDDLVIEEQWDVPGTHYARTARRWLENLDSRRESALAVLAEGDSPVSPQRQFQRWRLFFLACEELFAWDQGREWLVAHYRLQPA